MLVVDARIPGWRHITWFRTRQFLSSVFLLSGRRKIPLGLMGTMYSEHHMHRFEQIYRAWRVLKMSNNACSGAVYYTHLRVTTNKEE